jgi:hypothetical protein
MDVESLCSKMCSLFVGLPHDVRFIIFDNILELKRDEFQTVTETFVNRTEAKKVSVKRNFRCSHNVDILEQNGFTRRVAYDSYSVEQLWALRGVRKWLCHMWFMCKQL